MQSNRLYGYALIVGAVLLLTVGATHPTGAKLFESRESFEHVALVDRFAHSAGIAGLWLTVVGFAGFSRFLGAERPTVAVAFITITIATGAGLVAPAIDGFVVPQLGDRWFVADEATRSTLRLLMQYCVMIASALTRVYFVFASAAILLYSSELWRTQNNRGLARLGAFVALAAIATAVGGPSMVSVHELLALVVGQAIWMIWAGTILLKKLSQRAADTP
ncbi:MAG: hypothetical protein JO133_08225 [Burkholderiaceae bacterium]|nr:hypothetical protein [Burkholderiaceae bacterium]